MMTAQNAAASKNAATSEPADAGLVVPAGAGRAPLWRRTAASRTALLFLAPGFLLFLALIIYPMVRAFQMSFYDWNIVAVSVSRFTGFGNYSRAFHDPVFWRA